MFHLIFGFQPKFVVVSQLQGTDTSSDYVGQMRLFFISGMTLTKTDYMYESAGGNTWCWIAQTGNKLSWYTNSAVSQLNVLSQTAYYVCVG